MKKLFKVTLVVIGLLFAGSYAQAQVKIAHLNFNALIDQMPEAKTIKTQLDAYQKQFIDQNTTMATELQTKAQAYETKRTGMTDASKTASEKELQDLQKRIQEFQNDARQKIEEKSNELSKPLFTKARAAISQVAKEKGYAYVLDSSQIELLVAPDGDDILAPVKTKLGLK